MSIMQQQQPTHQTEQRIGGCTKKKEADGCVQPCTKCLEKKYALDIPVVLTAKHCDYLLSK
jgi:hypothetical protein